MAITESVFSETFRLSSSTADEVFELTPIELNAIACVMGSDGQLCQKWTLLLPELGLSKHEPDLEDIKKSTDSFAVFFVKLLQMWKQSMGRKASVEHLAQVLKKWQFTHISETLLKCIDTKFQNQGIWFEIQQPKEIFVGRLEQLQKMEKHWVKFKRNSMSSNSLLVYSGMGGVGKSELCRQFAFSVYKNHNANAIWIQAETNEAISSSLERLGAVMNLELKTEEIKDKISVLLNHLSNLPNASLIIFDNVEESTQLLNDILSLYELLSPFKNKPCLLFTTRNQCLFDVTKEPFNLSFTYETTDLSVLGVEDAVEFVSQYSGITDKKEALRIAVAVGCLPLGLSIASAYIKQESSKLNFDLEKYIQSISTKHNTNASCLLKKTWERSFEKIKYLQMQGSRRNSFVNTFLKKGICGPFKILSVLAYLSPNGVYCDVLHKLGFEKHLEDDLKTLMTYSLINVSGKVITIHRLVQEAFIGILSPGEQMHSLKRIVARITSVSLSQSIHVLSKMHAKAGIKGAQVKELVQQMSQNRIIIHANDSVTFKAKVAAEILLQLYHKYLPKGDKTAEVQDLHVCTLNSEHDELRDQFSKLVTVFESRNVSELNEAFFRCFDKTEILAELNKLTKGDERWCHSNALAYCGFANNVLKSVSIVSDNIFDALRLTVGKSVAGILENLETLKSKAVWEIQDFVHASILTIFCTQWFENRHSSMKQFFWYYIPEKAKGYAFAHFTVWLIVQVLQNKFKAPCGFLESMLLLNVEALSSVKDVVALRLQHKCGPDHEWTKLLAQLPIPTVTHECHEESLDDPSSFNDWTRVIYFCDNFMTNSTLQEKVERLNILSSCVEVGSSTSEILLQIDKLRQRWLEDLMFYENEFAKIQNVTLSSMTHDPIFDKRNMSTMLAKHTALRCAYAYCQILSEKHARLNLLGFCRKHDDALKKYMTFKSNVKNSSFNHYDIFRNFKSVLQFAKVWNDFVQKNRYRECASPESSCYWHNMINIIQRVQKDKERLAKCIEILSTEDDIGIDFNWYFTWASFILWMYEYERCTLPEFTVDINFMCSWIYTHGAEKKLKAELPIKSSIAIKFTAHHVIALLVRDLGPDHEWTKMAHDLSRRLKKVYL